MDPLMRCVDISRQRWGGMWNSPCGLAGWRGSIMHYSHRLSNGRLAQIVGTFVLIPALILAVAGF